MCNYAEWTDHKSLLNKERMCGKQQLIRPAGIKMQTSVNDFLTVLWRTLLPWGCLLPPGNNSAWRITKINKLFILAAFTSAYFSTGGIWSTHLVIIEDFEYEVVGLLMCQIWLISHTRGDLQAKPTSLCTWNTDITIPQLFRTIHTKYSSFTPLCIIKQYVRKETRTRCRKETS